MGLLLPRNSLTLGQGAWKQAVPALEDGEHVPCLEHTHWYMLCLWPSPGSFAPTSPPPSHPLVNLFQSCPLCQVPQRPALAWGLGAAKRDYLPLTPYRSWVWPPAPSPVPRAPWQLPSSSFCCELDPFHGILPKTQLSRIPQGGRWRRWQGGWCMKGEAGDCRGLGVPNNSFAVMGLIMAKDSALGLPLWKSFPYAALHLSDSQLLTLQSGIWFEPVRGLRCACLFPC